VSNVQKIGVASRPDTATDTHSSDADFHLSLADDDQLTWFGSKDDYLTKTGKILLISSLNILTSRQPKHNKLEMRGKAQRVARPAQTYLQNSVDLQDIKISPNFYET